MNLGYFRQKYQHKIDYKDKTSRSYLTYSSWRSMLYRCEKDVDSCHYGLSICEDWHDFDEFISDMGERPNQNHQIDRIDNSKGYFKDNCRWVTCFQQAANRRKSKNPKSSKFIGVSYHKRDCFWYAYIQIEKKMIYIGCKFTSELEALDARNDYVIENELHLKGFSVQFV